MSSPISFEKNKELENGLGRSGVIKTPHGDIETPAFIVVGTKATVKGLTVDMVAQTGAQAVLANTYHLFLQPGERIVAEAGGLHSFMNWSRPIVTDSGGFQVFSLGEAFGHHVSKIASGKEKPTTSVSKRPAHISEDGVTFKDSRTGDTHFLSPERSMEIQHALGADIFFAFDECTSPQASYEYQKEAMERTHRWAKRCVSFHEASANCKSQGLFGVVQGGLFRDLREESANFMAELPFSGFGIGGSFTKADLDTAVGWVCRKLPEDKPRHLLGIGEPLDIFSAVEQGIDTFDCVTPTRLGRSGIIYTRSGKINLLNRDFKTDFRPLDLDQDNIPYTRAYLPHLFRSKEMLGPILASQHNVSFLVRLCAEIRQSIIDGTYESYKRAFIESYRC